MERKWWFQRHGMAYGPYKSREEAANAFFATKAGAKAIDVMTGHGTYGPSFDIHWVGKGDNDNDQNNSRST